MRLIGTSRSTGIKTVSLAALPTTQSAWTGLRVRERAAAKRLSQVTAIHYQVTGTLKQCWSEMKDPPKCHRYGRSWIQLLKEKKHFFQSSTSTNVQLAECSFSL